MSTGSDMNDVHLLHHVSNVMMFMVISYLQPLLASDGRYLRVVASRLQL